MLILHSHRMPYCPYNGQPFPGTETTLASNVNAPLAVTAPASNRPQDVALVPIVMVVSASTLP